MSRPLGPYGRLARFIYQNRVRVLLAAAVLTVLSVLGASRLDVDSNLLALLPDEEPAAAALKKLHAEEGGANLVTLSFTAEDPAAIDPFLDDLVVRMEGLDGIDFAIHEVDEELAFELGLLQLSTEEVQELTGRLRGALALGPALNPIVLQRLMDMGPLTEKIGQAGNTSLLGREEEGKGRVLIRPTGSSTDPAFSKQVMEDIERAVAEANPGGHGVALQWIGGAYRHNVEDREGIWLDIQRTSMASAAFVLLVIAVAFRNLRATVLLYAPLLVANAFNLTLVWLLYGTVNTYTSFGTAILLGLGIDYGIHLVGRYRELATRGYSMEEAIAVAWDRSGPPCATSAITSIAGFLALSTARFEGFAQLGIVLGIGLFVTMLSALVLTPALIPYLDPNPKALLGVTQPRERTRLATYRLAPLGLMMAVLLTGLAATRLPLLEWEFDISTLRRAGLAYEELTPDERALARESYSPVVITYDSRDEVAADTARLEALRQAGELPHVARVVSIETVIPHDQEARLHALEQLAAVVEHPNMRYLEVRAPPLAENLVRLRGFEADPIRREQLPKALLTLLGAGRDSDYRILLFPKGNMWDLREAAALADEVHAAVPDRSAAGEYIALGALYRVVVADMPLVGTLALLLVALLTAIDLKKLHWFAGAYGTLLAGLIWAGVAIQAMGVKLSILNVVGVPILVGIGVDVCIHLLHRLREEGPGGVMRALQTTGVAAIISTVTTVAAFTSLFFAGNRGIRSLGTLVSVGLTTVFLVAAVLLPLAWAAGWRVTGRAPSHTGKRHHRPPTARPAPPRVKDGGASGSSEK